MTFILLGIGVGLLIFILSDIIIDNLKAIFINKPEVIVKQTKPESVFILTKEEIEELIDYLPKRYFLNVNNIIFKERKDDPPTAVCCYDVKAGNIYIFPFKELNGYYYLNTKKNKKMVFKDKERLKEIILFAFFHELGHAFYYRKYHIFKGQEAENLADDFAKKHNLKDITKDDYELK